ncbi:MAG: phosphopyruvate hydratase [Candidatus Roizmanbacteria bacterium]|nr:phosphopyruvate hydratase [Candidatus Roizmanbacteria bacterium]
MRIKDIRALEILDSRGNPTLRAYVELENGVIGVSSVPSGASTGTHEAHELRDNDPKRYMGTGVLMAKHNVESEIRELLVGKDPQKQDDIDHAMMTLDGTPNKSRLGANAILAVSLACAVAAARAQERELYEYLGGFFEQPVHTIPVPLINVINGGKHAQDSSDFQEYILIPYGFPRFSEALRASAEVFHTLKKMLHVDHQPTSVGDEGGFAPHVSTNEKPLQYLVDAVEEASYMMRSEFGLGIDAAASEFLVNGKYVLSTNNKQLSAVELANYYNRLIETYPLCSLEDHFGEDEWDSFQKFTQEIGETVQTVGDDLYVTNPIRLERGIAEKTTNAILIKVNQIGTLTETLSAIKNAKKAGMQTIISHRSGETEDTFIADLAVASNAGQIKTGSMSRSERIAKYNRLLEIEHKEPHFSYYQFPYKITNGF